MSTPSESDETLSQVRALADLGVPQDALDALSLLAPLGGPFAALADARNRHAALVREAAANIDALSGRGWGLASLPVPEQTRARLLVEAGNGDDADLLLAGLWEDDRRTGRVVGRVGTLGALDPTYRSLSQHRRRLLAKARDHHHSGAYEASVPIVLAQVEGITIDVAEGLAFFSRHPTKAADVEDLTQFVSIAAALPAVRTAYTGPVTTTQATGNLSRHGILHGRELAYDTKVISAKVWSLLADVVEWAMPRAHEISQRSVDARRAARAGSDAVSSRGQRLDDREFLQTRETLRWLSAVQLGQFRNTGRFHHDVVAGWRLSAKDFERHGLPTHHGVESRVSEDGQLWWAWRRTVSGWVLGFALRADGGSLYEHMYAGPTPPTATPTEAETWGAAWDTPPDWTSLDEG